MSTPTHASIRLVGSPPAPDHVHVADLDTCLEFINTEAYDDGVPQERLVTVHDAVHFLANHGLGHAEVLRNQALSDTDAWLERVHASRTAMREVWDAEVLQRTPDQRALDTVNAILRDAPRIELVAGDACCVVGHRHTADDPTGEALARLVQPMVEAIASGTTDRFRICANDGCRWVFTDTSRAGRRRWCDMSSCGNVAKVRRYRSKRRQEAAEASPTGAVPDAPPSGA